MMARLPGVPRSGHCSRLGAGGRLDPPAGPKGVAAAPWEGGGRTSGRRRVKAGLLPERSGASGHPVLKSMRELGVRGFRPRAAKRTAAPGPGAPARPDLARGRLNPPVPTAVPCGDIAYLKKETCHRRTFETHEEAETARIDWVERSYNRSRPHSAIGYRHPADLMAEFQNRMEAMFKEENYLAA